eukprot:m.106960 g.106960  ORF g.106960 m.106960 type:complete len:245 (-) comp27761_c1_seq1:54-788(-)
MDDYEVAVIVADKAIGENDTYCEKGFPIFKDVKHTVPKLVALVMALIMIIAIAATTYEERCLAGGSGRVNRGYDQVNGMSFLLSIGVMVLIVETVFMFLYYFWGLNRLTRVGWKHQLPDGSIRYSYVSWWSFEISMHIMMLVFVFFSACVAAGGLAKNIKDLEELVNNPSVSCSYKKEEMGGFDFALVLAFVLLFPMGFGVYHQFKGLKADHGCCPNPFKPVPGAVPVSNNNDKYNQDATVHSV